MASLRHPSNLLLVIGGLFACGFAVSELSSAARADSHPVIVAAARPSVHVLAQTAPVSESWMAIVEKLGFPVAMVAVLLGAFWKAGNWFAANVAQPFISAHLSFISETQKAQDKQTEMLNQVAAAQNKAVDNQAQIVATQARMLGLIEDHFERRANDRRGEQGS